jgi:hypothetical protein
LSAHCRKTWAIPNGACASLTVRHLSSSPMRTQTVDVIGMIRFGFTQYCLRAKLIYYWVQYIDFLKNCGGCEPV